MGENNHFITTNGLEFENFKVTMDSEEGNDNHDELINFSIKLVELLQSKADEHNSTSPQNKVSLNDLKRVYIRGAGDCSSADKAEITCGEWALARVNMFLRQKIGGAMKTTAAELKIGSANVDISETWVPSEEDYLKASEEIEKHKLNYNFENVNELYIEPYERLQIEW
tara:strand:+ start:40099 stop:40605 length:507 start_codon:yes stop_codon:yes gene_type:complete